MPGIAELIEQFLDPGCKTVEPKVGQRGVVRVFADPSSIDEDKRRIRFRCSTGTIDRYGEIVEPAAFKDSLELFLTNPVFLAGHTHVGPAGEATVIGTWDELKVTESGLEGWAKFMTDDVLAESYWQRYKQRAMRAVSVGFLVEAYTMEEREISPKEKAMVRVFTKVELIEISAVAVPANRDALVRGLAMLGAGGDGAGGEDQTNIEQAAKHLQPLIEEALRQGMDPGPDGFLRNAIEDVVARNASHGSSRVHSYFDDDIPADEREAPELSDDDSNDDTGDHELKNILLDTLGRNG